MRKLRLKSMSLHLPLTSELNSKEYFDLLHTVQGNFHGGTNKECKVLCVGLGKLGDVLSTINDKLQLNLTAQYDSEEERNLVKSGLERYKQRIESHKENMMDDYLSNHSFHEFLIIDFNSYAYLDSSRDTGVDRLEEESNFMKKISAYKNIKKELTVHSVHSKDLEFMFFEAKQFSLSQISSLDGDVNYEKYFFKYVEYIDRLRVLAHGSSLFFLEDQIKTYFNGLEDEFKLHKKKLVYLCGFMNFAKGRIDFLTQKTMDDKVKKEVDTILTGKSYAEKLIDMFQFYKNRWKGKDKTSNNRGNENEISSKDLIEKEIVKNYNSLKKSLKVSEFQELKQLILSKKWYATLSSISEVNANKENYSRLENRERIKIMKHILRNIGVYIPLLATPIFMKKIFVKVGTKTVIYNLQFKILDYLNLNLTKSDIHKTPYNENINSVIPEKELPEVIKSKFPKIITKKTNIPSLHRGIIRSDRFGSIGPDGKKMLGKDEKHSPSVGNYREIHENQLFEILHMSGVPEDQIKLLLDQQYIGRLELDFQVANT